jgi:hypothetical protein
MDVISVTENPRCFDGWGFCSLAAGTRVPLGLFATTVPRIYVVTICVGGSSFLFLLTFFSRWRNAGLIYGIVVVTRNVEHAKRDVEKNAHLATEWGFFVCFCFCWWGWEVKVMTAGRRRRRLWSNTTTAWRGFDGFHFDGFQLGARTAKLRVRKQYSVQSVAVYLRFERYGLRLSHLLTYMYHMLQVIGIYDMQNRHSF